MRRHMLERALWGCAVVGFLVVVAGSRRDPAEEISTTIAVIPGSHAFAGDDSLRLTVAARRIVERHPFRLDRRPAEVRFDPNPSPAPPPTPPVPPPPVQTPVLLGIIGPPWRAILEGIPGRNGSVVVRVGVELGPFTVMRITRDTVVVQTPDTTLALTVRRQWR